MFMLELKNNFFIQMKEYKNLMKLLKCTLPTWLVPCKTFKLPCNLLPHKGFQNTPRNFF
jgi:hypothetical protein